LPKLRSLLYGYTERFNFRFPFGFFILLDLIIFTEAIKILQKLTDHAQLNKPLIHAAPKKGLNYI